MPTFDTLHYAKHARRAQPEEYVGSIQRVAFGQAEKLEFGEGEPTLAVKRRLNAAAEALGKELQVRRSANAVYFWAPRGPAPRQASQEPGRVAPSHTFLDPTAHLSTEEGVVAIAQPASFMPVGQ